MAKYMYPAKFTQEDDGGFSVIFTDFDFEGSKYGIATQGDDLESAMKMAKDALCMMLYHAEQENADLPTPSKIQDIKVTKNEFVQYISCDTKFYEEYYKKKLIKKTLSIPSYLNVLGEREGVNFSAVLQEALKQKLLGQPTSSSSPHAYIYEAPPAH